MRGLQTNVRGGTGLTIQQQVQLLANSPGTHSEGNPIAVTSPQWNIGLLLIMSQESHTARRDCVGQCYQEMHASTNILHLQGVVTTLP